MNTRQYFTVLRFRKLKKIFSANSTKNNRTNPARTEAGGRADTTFGFAPFTESDPAVDPIVLGCLKLAPDAQDEPPMIAGGDIADPPILFLTDIRAIEATICACRLALRRPIPATDAEWDVEAPSKSDTLFFNSTD